MFRAASETSSWFKASRDGSSKSDSAFSFRHESDLYQYYHQNPWKGARFACAMAGVAQCMLGILVPVFLDRADRVPSASTQWQIIRFPNFGMITHGRLSELLKSSTLAVAPAIHPWLWPA